MSIVEKGLGWDDEIQNDGDEFVLLTPGEYAFEIKSYERAHHKGSDKLPSCNMAIVNIEVDGKEQGTAMIKHRLFLHTRTEGMICAFFIGIGARKHGEKMVMDWNSIVGKTGHCKTSIHKWQDKEYNQIKSFLEPMQTEFTEGEF